MNHRNATAVDVPEDEIPVPSFSQGVAAEAAAFEEFRLEVDTAKSRDDYMAGLSSVHFQAPNMSTSRVRRQLVLTHGYAERLLADQANKAAAPVEVGTCVGKVPELAYGYDSPPGVEVSTTLESSDGAVCVQMGNKDTRALDDIIAQQLAHKAMAVNRDIADTLATDHAAPKVFDFARQEVLHVFALSDHTTGHAGGIIGG